MMGDAMATSMDETSTPFWLTPDEAGQSDGFLLWALGRSPLLDEPYEFIPLFCKTPNCNCQKIGLDVIDRSTRRSVATLVVHCGAETFEQGLPRVEAMPAPDDEMALYPVILKALGEEPDYLCGLEKSYHLIRAALRSPAGSCDAR